MVTPIRMLLAALFALGAGAAAPSRAADTAADQPQSCHSSDALGVARTMQIGGTPAIGLKSYDRTLDLRDHEVVLTFDDGPWGPTTPDVLDALDAQCVKATFFLIGRNAQAHPGLVRREIAEGHTVGHHTWDHPAMTLRNMSAEAGIVEIERGMRADDRAAGLDAWTGRPRVPFFRFPGFGDSPGTRSWLQARGIAIFGADLWASDWIPMTPDAELALLMQRLRTAGRGIILLHDIKRQTADMLPAFLSQLKAEGFRVVHLVPGGTDTATRPAPAGWTSETERTLDHMWPKARAEARPKGSALPGRAADDPALKPSLN